MYAMITCRPDIVYAVTTLLKFLTSPSVYHYKLLQSVAKYLKSTINWGICFKQTSPMIIDESQYEENQEKGGFSLATLYSIPNDPTLTSSFDVDIGAPVLHCFIDAAYANDLRKRRSTTGVVFTFCGGAIIYKSKTQNITASSLTEAEFIAAHTAGKITRYLRMVSMESGFKQNESTIIHIDNLPALNIINNNTNPTQRSRHCDIRFFQLQDWREELTLSCKHVKGILNPSDDLRKPLGYVLHSRHCRQIMGHY